MRVKKLVLRNFRNYSSLSLCPDSALTVLCGANAQGKTNVLEALHLCCLGRSHRTTRDRELIAWGQDAASVNVEVAQRDGTHDVSVQLYTQEKRKKLVRVGGTQVARIGELMGHLNGVLFSPEDMSIVKDGPGERRRFMDMELSQMRTRYFYALQQYVRALQQRNNLLREISKNGSLLKTLDDWDEQLVRVGAVVVENRRDYMQTLALEAAESHLSISGGEVLQVRYKSQFDGASDVPAAFLAKLKQVRSDDLRRMSTSVGPHRDDMLLFIDGKEARVYASQGQQRTIVLSLKLAELQVIKKERGETPVLMLDDVMSELDPKRRKQLIERIDGVQTLVTCTDMSDLAGAKTGVVYQVNAGTLSLY